MKKVIVLAIIFAFVSLALVSKDAFSAGFGKLSKLALAECLVKRKKIPIPPTADKLNKAEYFKILANSLAEKGINAFQNSNPNDVITCSMAIDLLYNAAGGTENLDTSAKINFLEKRAYISSAADPTGSASTCEEILCEPPVEEYSPASEPILGNPPDFIPERHGSPN